MPTYTYKCETCGEFEISHPISAPPVATCPDCGAPVIRLISGGTGFIMKGGGGGGRRDPMSCGRDRPCCGRETRCDRPPCDE